MRKVIVHCRNLRYTNLVYRGVKKDWLLRYNADGTIELVIGKQSKYWDDPESLLQAIGIAYERVDRDRDVDGFRNLEHKLPAKVTLTRTYLVREKPGRRPAPNSNATYDEVQGGKWDGVQQDEVHFL